MFLFGDRSPASGSQKQMSNTGYIVMKHQGEQREEVRVDAWGYKTFAAMLMRVKSAFLN